MNERKRYFEIVKSARDQKRVKRRLDGLELHHVLPKALFPLWKDRSSNLVLLTAKEHYEAHRLLCSIYPRMTYAFWRMCHDGRHDFITADEYAELRFAIAKEQSTRFKGVPLSEEHRQAIINAHCGGINHWKSDSKNKMITSNLKTWGDPEVRRRHSELMSPIVKSAEVRRKNSENSKKREYEKRKKYGKVYAIDLKSYKWTVYENENVFFDAFGLPTSAKVYHRALMKNDVTIRRNDDCSRLKFKPFLKGYNFWAFVSTSVTEESLQLFANKIRSIRSKEYYYDA